MGRKIKISKKIISVVLFLVAAFAIYFFWIKPKYNQTPPARIAEVTIVTIAKQQVQLFLELPARVEAQKISDVRPQAEGVIRKIKFTEGSFVKKGQQLYQIE